MASDPSIAVNNLRVKKRDVLYRPVRERTSTRSFADAAAPSGRMNSLERVFYLASAPGATTDTITSWPIQAI